MSALGESEVICVGLNDPLPAGDRQREHVPHDLDHQRPLQEHAFYWRK